jgi:hypothetical protein
VQQEKEDLKLAPAASKTKGTRLVHECQRDISSCWELELKRASILGSGDGGGGGGGGDNDVTVRL